MKTSLNHTYRLVWSDALQTFVPVAECARGRGKGGKKSARARSLLLGMALLSGAAVQAQLPTGGQVVAGSASMATQGSTLTITQTSERMAADWQSFSIGKGHTVNFVQPGSNAVALNRVLGSDVSVIQGALNANGQVFLVNPNGVLFTKDAQVNVGGILASTLNISTQDFMAGNYKFEGASSNAIVNQGRITAHGNGQGGGTVALIAAKISNEGTLTAEKGNVLMGAGRKVTLDLGGPVKIQVEEGALDVLIEQGGAIKADGGLVYLTAKSAGDLVSTVINHTGITEAQTLATGEKGEIYLMGDMAKGRVSVGGTLKAEGGFIETSSAKVQVQEGSQIRAGHWLIDPYDFTIAATGGDISGVAVGNALANGNVTIQTTNTNVSCNNITGCGTGTVSGNGDIFVNDGITWSSGNTLLLSAYRNIEINALIDASQGGGGVLGLAYGQGAVPTGNTATYTINAPVKLQSGVKFATVFGSGGSQVNYTVVNSQGALQAINLNGNYALGSSLSFAGNWTPIGSGWNNCDTMFCGKFDGLGNTISNVTIAPTGVVSGDGVGFFAAMENASVRNLTLDQLSVNTDSATLPYGSAVGGLVGWQVNSVVNNVHIKNATITANNADSTSGLAGWLGYNANAVISNSSANAVVSANNYAGGLVGNFDGGQILNSHTSGSVTSKDASNLTVGGLVGFNSGSIQNAYSVATVTTASTGTSTNSRAGGLVGINGSQGSITNTYATGAVTGVSGSYTTYIGGLVGDNQNPVGITNSFWDINSTGKANGVGNGILTGAVPLGAGISDGAGGTYDRSPYKFGESVGGVFTYGTLSGSWIGFDFDKTWWIADGATRPFLRSEWRPVITNAHQLQLMAMKPDHSYVLANSIDLDPSLSKQSEMWRDLTASSSFVKGSFLPIGYQVDDNTGAPAFTGVFDGQGFTISNLYINRPNSSGLPYADQIGLFGELQDATIKDLNLTGSVRGYGQVGALAGSALGTTQISGVTSSVTVLGNAEVGGLVGRVQGSDDAHRVSISTSSSSSSGTLAADNATAGGLVGNAEYFSITDSSASGNVTAEYYVGGLVALSSNGTISRSHASGTVTGDADGDVIGGLVGSAWNVVIENSYATGDVAGGYLTGGLVGIAYSGTITGSYATGKVTAGDDAGNIGGLVGKAFGGTTITRSYASGAVEVDNNPNGWGGNIGGLVGYVDGGSVSQSYATGNVTAGNNARRVGGLLGQFYGNGDTSSADYQVTDSYASGSVTVGTGSEGVGGLIGSAEYSYVARTYAVGAVVAGADSSGVGRLFGFNDGTVVSSFWDTETTGTSITRGVGSGVSDPAGVTGKSTAQMQDIATFADWDIEDNQSLTEAYPRLTLTGSSPVWKIKSVPLGIPVSYTFSMLTGNYTYNGNPYQLSNLWSAEGLFGSTYSSWVAGTDYDFKYSGNTVTGFTNAGTYSGITVDILKSGFLTASSSNTPGSLTIDKAPLTVTANNASMIYNGSAYAGTPGVRYSGFVTPTGGSQETSAVLGGTLAYAYSTASPTNAGTYTITPNGYTSGNYAITYGTGTLTIDQKALTVTGLTAQNKIYNGTTAATVTGTAGLSGVVGSDSVSLSGTVAGAFAEADVGTDKAVSVTGLSLTGSAAGNYTLAVPSGFVANITARPITVTADAKNKTYGDTDPALTYQVTSGNLVSGDTLSGVLSRAAGENVGSYSIDASALANGNYLITANNGTLTISQRPITVTADAKSKTYGDTDPALTYQLTSGNLVGGDTLSGVLSRAAGEKVGSYNIDASALANGNYLITVNNGMLTIKANTRLDITVASAQTAAMQPVSSTRSMAPATPASQSSPSPILDGGGVQLSGGLTFVDVKGGTTSGTAQRNGGEGGEIVFASANGAGRDASGFMRVFVVNGGINLPDQASATADQNVGGQNENTRRNQGGN